MKTVIVMQQTLTWFFRITQIILKIILKTILLKHKHNRLEAEVEAEAEVEVAAEAEGEDQPAHE
jgi:hypothetical protein